MKKWKVFGLLFLLLGSAYLSYQYYLTLLPMMDAYGELQIRQFTSAIIIHEKRTVFASSLEDELISVSRDAQGGIESIDYHLIYANQLTDDMVARTETTIKEVQAGNYQAKDASRYEKYLESISEREGVITTIPLESLISFPPVSFLHCRIPVRYQVESNVVGKVVPRVEAYGINNTMIEIIVTVSMQQKMLLPFFHDIKTIEIEFPIAMKIVHGQVPNTYLGGQIDG